MIDIKGIIHSLEFARGRTLGTVERIDKIVGARGYSPSRNWVVRNFPGQKHNEISWASRIDVPLQFLLPPDRR